VFYFAYGSNMNWQQMQRRCPSSQFFCLARLPGYHFAIARHSRLRRCGTANIFPRADREVWGIVYEVSDSDLLILDSFEDGYRREKVFVFRDGESRGSIEVLTYIAEKEDNAPLPNPEYKRLIVEGAKHWNVPEAYRMMLEEIQVVSG